ncbi:MAG: DUF402 domain-containing protein [Candidatus Nezhaarchaeales archaeon]
MVMVKIRGIYATALSSLLLRKGFTIVQCSTTMSKRLSIPKTIEVADALIFDDEDAAQLIVRGKPKAVSMLIESLREELPDLIVKDWMTNVYSIHRGVVIDTLPQGVKVSVYGGEGFLPEKTLQVGDEVTVTLVKPSFEGKPPLLTRRIQVVGPHVKLIFGGWVSVSERIKNPSRVRQLFNLGCMVKPNGWGIKWRSTAVSASTEGLMLEVKELMKVANEVMAKANKVKAPSLLLEGEQAVKIYVPLEAKIKLDNIRGQVTPTTPKHHLIKSWGKPFAAAIDLVEKLLEEDKEAKLNLAMVTNILLRKALRVGSRLSIIHMKPDGTVISLTPGVIEEVNYDDETLKVKRKFNEGGVYDGLGIPKEKGDYGLTELSAKAWVVKTTYYSANGKIKGEYYSISTPAEIMPRKAKYMDLGVDVVKTASGRVQVLDVDEPKLWYAKGYISKWLMDKALNEAKRIEEELTSR